MVPFYARESCDKAYNLVVFVGSWGAVIQLPAFLGWGFADLFGSSDVSRASGINDINKMSPDGG
jgi:hypothetical protein